MNNHYKGEKRTCPHCELKFFDLNRDKLECPRCKNEIIIESLKRKSTGSEASFSNKKKEEEIILETSDLKDDDNENVDDETVEEDDNSTIVDID